jgi:hypothetical protein
MQLPLIYLGLQTSYKRTNCDYFANSADLQILLLPSTYRRGMVHKTINKTYFVAMLLKSISYSTWLLYEARSTWREPYSVRNSLALLAGRFLFRILKYSVCVIASTSHYCESSCLEYSGYSTNRFSCIANRVQWCTYTSRVCKVEHRLELVHRTTPKFDQIFAYVFSFPSHLAHFLHHGVRCWNLENCKT